MVKQILAILFILISISAARAEKKEEPSNITISGISVAKDHIDFSLAVHRGSTLKRTLSIWLEDMGGRVAGEKIKRSFPNRSMDYFSKETLNFSRCIPSGKYTIVAEGLGNSYEETIDVDIIDCGTGRDKIHFFVENYTRMVVSGEDITVLLRIKNKSNIDGDVEVLASIKGENFTYSLPKKILNFPSDSEVSATYSAKVEMKPGLYMLNISLVRDSDKYSLLLPVEVVLSPDRKSDVLFSSSSAKAFSLIGYFIIASLFIVVALLSLNKV